MNHYDDLHRFKEKTRTQSLHFKDLSSQAPTREQGDWIILNQLTPGEEKESSLAMGGSVSLPIPQPVPADMFHWVEAEPVQSPAPTPVVKQVATPPIPEPVASSVAAAVPVEPPPLVAPAAPPVMADPTPAIAAAPAPRIAPRPAVTAAQTNDGFAYLFAAKAAEPAAKNKDQLLKSLLGRIATCR
ncbi:cellulose biosynthesis protein BcsO (plasmid) [Klebsiella sp. WOUb02]|uniref:cellulose biosynthesis protein BcsO n=1 Tax=Klebsiella sp. WOUb02 TaxID=3161071 RepID=UPI003CF66935